MNRKNIKIIRCQDKQEASEKALSLVLKGVDSGTLLLLSGGSSPGLLYKLIAQNSTLKPGAVALIDERFGKQMHDNSNEKMIFNTGLTRYLENAGIPIFKILRDRNLKETQVEYEKVVRDFIKNFAKKVAIMGIGTDGHTAGIKPDLEYDHTKFVAGYEDKDGLFGSRITLTIEALDKIDEFIVLVFGESKRDILERMLEEKDQKKFPACFYVKSPAKTTILTDIEE
ncbi:6-phosphogluconolactonase [Candidatus Daviesbacteria bacterium]|nr:6-phosphogluconolactonase [Candidatus Daviesbacteria bacterium]